MQMKSQLRLCSPQYISEASQQNRVEALLLTTEVAGDLF